MKIITVVDDSMGLMFNGRRQSQDRVLREHILNDTNGEKLWMSGYSAKQFTEGLPENAEISENFLELIKEGEYAFIEGDHECPDDENIEELILYKWNRKYPGDVFLNIDLTGFSMTEAEDFAGSSHEKITREVYRKN